MTTINRLALLDTPSTADQVPVYSSSNGDARRMPINALLSLFQSTFSSPTLAVQVYTPGTGFNITAPTPSSNQQWVCIQPAGTLATGTVTLPLNTTTPDGTEVLVTTTQQITAFTVGANGAAQVFGAPTTLAANAFFRLRFITAQNCWYRIS